MIAKTLTAAGSAEFTRMDRAFMKAADNIRAVRNNAGLGVLHTLSGTLHGLASASAYSLRTAWNHKGKTALAGVAALGIAYQDEIAITAKQSPYLLIANLCEAAPTCSDDEAMGYRVDAALIEATYEG